MSADTSSPQSPPNIGCALVWAGFLLLFQITSVLHVLQLPDRIARHITFPTELQVILGVTWALLWAHATVALVRRKAFALRYISWLTILFTVYLVLRLVIFAAADYDRGRLSFLIIGVIVILALPIITLLRGASSKHDL